MKNSVSNLINCKIFPHFWKSQKNYSNVNLKKFVNIENFPITSFPCKIPQKPLNVHSTPVTFPSSYAIDVYASLNRCVLYIDYLAKKFQVIFQWRSWIDSCSRIEVSKLDVF